MRKKKSDLHIIQQRAIDRMYAEPFTMGGGDEGDELHSAIMKLHSFAIANPAVASVLPVSTPMMIDRVNGLNSRLFRLSITNRRVRQLLVKKSKTVHNRKGLRRL